VELIDVDSGRNILPDADDLDVSATVGWLATSRVLVLKRGGTEDLEASLRGLQQQLQALPNRGMGYKFLSFLNHDPEIVGQLRPLAKGQVLFNYMGQSGGAQRRSSDLVLGPAREHAGAREDPTDKDPAQLFCTPAIYAGQLMVDWMYSDQLHRRATIEQMAHRFLEILRRFGPVKA
jgi:non-ribosomal peptide synthase protein (TIGR01720 family)